MTTKVFIRPLLLGVVFALSLAGCDFSEQNIEWDPGTTLAIVGPITATGGAPDLTVPASGTRNLYFYVNGYNSSRTYTWTINGEPMPSLQGGEFTEFVMNSSTAPGQYTVSVSNGTHSGTRQFTVVVPSD